MKEPTEVRLWLTKTVAGQLDQVLDAMAGESPMAESRIDAEPPKSECSFWDVSLSSAQGGSIVLAAARSAWMDLGRRVLTAAGLDECDEETILSTFRETLDQALSGLAQAATIRLGREVTASPLKPGSYSANPRDLWSSVELVFGDAKSLVLSFLWNEKLIGGFAEASVVPAPPPPQTTVAPPVAVAALPGLSAAPARSMDVLYDVELPVSVSFGRAHMQLKDVLKLTTGSIVELNRTVAEPVEIIVNNCVVARGEVVVVEGNFGVRINEVISRQERLRTLH
jgi:flagellar motor switch protein FliN/FliY